VPPAEPPVPPDEPPVPPAEPPVPPDESAAANDLTDRLAAFEGCQSGPPVRAADPVNLPMIRHWVEAIGDANPVYVDEQAARASTHGGLIAPPAMLQAWVMRGLGAGGGEPSRQAELLRLLTDAGFSSVVATDCDQEYVRDLRPGDHLTLTTVIEGVSPEKQTAIGRGHFVTMAFRYTDDGGDTVATMRWRILKFRPGTGRRAATTEPGAPEPGAPATEPGAAAPGTGTAATPPGRPLRPRPALTRDNAWWFEALRAHRLLIQRCASCGVLRHPPRPMCDRCRSLEWDTVEASGRGTVFSFVVNHYPVVAAFDYPLVVGLIELAEGTRLIANLVGLDPSEVTIGQAVVAEFVDHDPGLSLAAFRPTAG